MAASMPASDCEIIASKLEIFQWAACRGLASKDAGVMQVLHAGYQGAKLYSSGSDGRSRPGIRAAVRPALRRLGTTQLAWI